VERFLASLPPGAAERVEAESLALSLRPDRGLTWVRSEPARVDFTKSEVTLEQYGACVAAGACRPPGPACNWDVRAERVQHPVNCVDWARADAFCAWAGGRLPTEEEWFAEASNGGLRTFPWGEEVPTCRAVVMDEGGPGCGRDFTAPVCSKPDGRSISGLCDLAGNVAEWTSTAEGNDRVMRGGSWVHRHREAFAARARAVYMPTDHARSAGFRCARSPR
jgi:formylglycine-generating enzyme required for sulfatase activity